MDDLKFDKEIRLIFPDSIELKEDHDWLQGSTISDNFYSVGFDIITPNSYTVEKYGRNMLWTYEITSSNIKMDQFSEIFRLRQTVKEREVCRWNKKRRKK